ncbi:MAG: acetolactate synthase [Lachnospiraceae bacterium]|nr:acetolactate synthase [Lachnospira sp.]MBQ8729790.1 acetolactate synthase [Lachnospiraceae bacterium]MBR6697473.1 acetolactate synthase [Lachnospiraceae bacterium]
MTVKQISVFIENKIGGLDDITASLANAGINIRALSIAETSDFGILRLIVDDVFKAGNVLKEAGHVYSLTDVVAVAGEDKPGSIAKIVSVLAKEGISLEYAYAFFTRNRDYAYMIIRVEDNDAAIKILRNNNIPVIGDEDLAKMW